MTMSDPINLTAEEVAKRLRVSTATLARYRWKGTGPEYIKSGGRVLYSEFVIDEWERKKTRSATRDSN